MPTYFFLLKDYEALQKAIQGVENQIAKTLKEMGKSMGDGADTWHDSFDYDEGQRESAMFSDRIRELIQIKNSAQVITPESSTGQAFIGRTVTIQDLETQETMTFQIGSFLVLGEEREVISYASPLAKMIQGARVGEVRNGDIGGQKKKYKIIKIE